MRIPPTLPPPRAKSALRFGVRRWGSVPAHSEASTGMLPQRRPATEPASAEAGPRKESSQLAPPQAPDLCQICQRETHQEAGSL